jgi:two-component system, LytTR family, sensor kinase
MSAPEFPIKRIRMYLFFIFVEVFVGFARFFMMPDKGLAFHAIGYILSCIGFCLLWESVLLSGKMFERRFPLASYPYARFFLQTIITYALLIIPSFFIQVEISSMLRVVGYLFYFLVAAVLNLIYMGVIYFFNWKENVVNLANAKREQAIVKYDALRNQLNPHFLFNALTSLNSLIFEDQQLASDFLQQLSKVYRYVLQNKDKETVTLATELNFISHYISLLKIRFMNAIEFDIKVAENYKEREIVPLTLQVLIENAVKHNIVSPSSPLRLTVKADGDYLVVENNINKKVQVETSNQLGLNNLVGFYKYLSEKPIVINERKKIFTVKIPLI